MDVAGGPGVPVGLVAFAESLPCCNARLLRESSDAKPLPRAAGLGVLGARPLGRCVGPAVSVGRFLSSGPMDVFVESWPFGVESGGRLSHTLEVICESSDKKPFLEAMGLGVSSAKLPRCFVLLDVSTGVSTEESPHCRAGLSASMGAVVTMDGSSP